ncbi:MAG: DUF805 domain-containing protein [Methylobacteriaceae bacterium]|jgi:uncharacterized membrane protein YhaH (DUF805 family)|nr:DUF805 domain-containing protein [Methylobacteriaceae bacterium]
MDFLTAVKTVLTQKYATFTGRARRAEFWWFVLFATICNSIGGAIHPLIGTVIGLALLCPNLAVGARRLHDLNLSGWWQAAPFGIVTVVGLLDAGIAMLAGLFIVVAFFMYLAKKGTDGPNRFGEDPLAGESGQGYV